MTSQSAQQGRTAAAPALPSPPGPPGRSSRAIAGRHSAAPGSELAAALRRGTGYNRCYDLFAAQLYRYCWTLLGPGGSGAEPDRAAAALHETFLAAAHRIDALGDDDEFAAWLFALARTAARRRGFTPRSPYAQLATAEDEQPAVQLSLRLAPSNRELLELYLRHGLPTPLIARILGLETETAAELCRTAVLRAAEQLTRYALAPSRTQGRGPDRGVRAVLAALEPPNPPPALRERVVEDCASPLAANLRRAAAEALSPLGANGFPLHRNRAPAAPVGAGAADGGPEAGPQEGEREPAALPADRVTTDDVPAGDGPDPVAAPAGGPEGSRQLSTALTALLAAAAVVVVLWSAVAAVRDYAGAVTDAGPPAPAPTAAPAQESTPADSAAAQPEDDTTVQADHATPEPIEDATLSAPTPDTAGAPGDARQEPPQHSATAAPGTAAPSAAAESPENGGAQSGGSGAEAAEESGGGSGGSDDGAAGPGEDAGSDSGGAVSGLFDGLIDFLRGESSEAG